MRRAYKLLCVFLLLCVPWQSAHALAMKISNISDFSLGSWGLGDGAIEANMQICIYGLNLPALLSYAITVSSAPSSYRLSSGSNFIPYSLYWEDSVGAPLGTQLSDGVKLAGQTNLNVLSNSCAIGGVNSKLTIRINEADMIAALAGKYSGTITLLLTPN